MQAIGRLLHDRRDYARQSSAKEVFMIGVAIVALTFIGVVGLGILQAVA